MAIGYFNDKEREYVITDMYPRRKLLNYLWNDTTVCACDQFGFGTSWSMMNGVRRQIESGVRNLSIHYGERLVFIKDMDSREYYSPNRNYKRVQFDIFECHVGLGYQKVIGEYKGVKTEFTTIVPIEGNAVQFFIQVKNISGRAKKLKLYFYAQPSLEMGEHEAYANARFDEKLNGIYYDTTGYNLSVEYIKSYFATDRSVEGYAVTPNDFKGYYGSYDAPTAVTERMPSKGSTFEEKYAGAFEYNVSLGDGETFETVIACGFGKSYEDCLDGAKRYANKKSFCEGWNKQRERNAESFNVFKVETPDEYVNSMTNIWLKRQLSLGKDWGRLYGRGFRDVMQDTSAFVSLDVALARKRIPEILKHQYEDGNPIRMFEPNYTHPYNDSGAWIPATVLAYLYESGDLSVLDEKIPYLKGDSYENAYTKGGFVPYAGTKEIYTVFDHIKRAMDYLYGSRGKRGLVLFRQGDWNDSMNSVGLQGKGESVWLAIATIKAHNEFIEILKLYGKSELVAQYEARRDELKRCVMEYGFDGEHLLYGYNDYDEKIGSDDNEYAKIYLNPQTWAVLADLTDKETLKKLMDNVESRLSCDFGYLQCVPSYRVGSDKIGRVSYFKAGLIENGSVYNHGVAFKIVADCLLGRGDAAYETFKKISYNNPKNPNNGMEPYAISNMYIGPENEYLAGYAPMAWVTGTAGWLYRALTEYICGVRPVRDGLLVKPCFPSHWKEASVTRIFRGGRYEIKLIRAETNKVVFNGKNLDGNVLPIGAKGETHDVVVYFK